MNEQNINLKKSTNPVEGPKKIMLDCKDQSDFDVEIVQVSKKTDDVILVDDIKTEDCDTSERLMKDLKALSNCIAPAEAYLRCRKRDRVQGESSKRSQASRGRQGHANRPKEVITDKAKKKVPRMTWRVHALVPDHITKYNRYIAEGINEEDARTLSLKPNKEYYKYKRALKKKKITDPKPDELNLETETPEVIVIDDDEEIASNVYTYTPAPQIGIKNKEPMSEDQQDMVKRSIIEAITEITELGTGPNFRKCLFMYGWIYIICENEHSRDWVVNLIENVKIKPWPDAMLSIITEDQLPMPRIGTVVVPNSEATTIDEFKKMLETQNKDLNTSKWKVHQKNVTPNGMALTLRLDAQSVETLRRLKCKPSLGFGKVTFKIKKEQFAYLDGIDKYKSFSTNEPDLSIPCTSQAHNDETVRESYADDERNTILESSEDHEREPQEDSQEAFGDPITPLDQPPTQQPEYEDWTKTSNSGVDWDDPIEPDPRETVTDESMPQEAGNRNRENLRNNLRKQPQNAKKQKPLTEPQEYENWSDSSNSGVDWDDHLEPDPRELARADRFIMPSQSGKRDTQMPSNSGPKRPRFRDDSRNDRRQHRNVQRKSFRWVTERDLDEERLQRDPVDRYSDEYPRHQYGKDVRDQTLRRDMQTQESMQEREQRPSGSSSQVIWSVGTIRNDTVNPIAMQQQTPERLSNPSHISWTIGPRGNSQCWRSPMQSEQHTMRTLQLNPYNTFRSISTTITNMPEFWIPSPTLGNSQFWSPPQHIERDPIGSNVPLRNFPVDSRDESNNPIRNRDVIEDFRRNRFPPVWQ